MVLGFGVSAESQSIGTIGKEQREVARSRGLVIQTQKLSIGAYFELSFLGCGFLIYLFTRSDSPRFRAPWKKICQKYGTQQEPSLFKGHPLSCTIRNFIHAFKQELLVHILSFHSQGVVSLFTFPTGPTALDSEPHGRRYVKNTGHNRNRFIQGAFIVLQYVEALCSMVPS